MSDESAKRIPRTIQLGFLVALLAFGTSWYFAHAQPILSAQPANRTPPGVITAYGGPVPPNGWLLCDGSEVSRMAHPRLFTAIGTSSGAGDGASTFHLPDLRGRFIRGVDDGAGRDPDASVRQAANSGGNVGDRVGSIQPDAFQGHFHKFRGNLIPYSGGGGSDFYAPRTGADPNVTVERDNITEAKSDGTNGNPRTTRETRPLNAYVHFIIKT